MRDSVLLEAIKLALINAVKEKVPEGGCVCGTCNNKFSHLHRVDVRGVKTFLLCEMCVEEFREILDKQQEVGVEHLFTNASGLLLGQRVLKNHIDSDMDSEGYYGVSQYQLDHME